MTRRLVDTLLFQASGVIGSVYDDGAGAGRSIAVVYTKQNGDLSVG